MTYVVMMYPPDTDAWKPGDPRYAAGFDQGIRYRTPDPDKAREYAACATALGFAVGIYLEDDLSADLFA